MAVLDRYQPTHLAICFDRKDPTFRHEFYSEYKGHRPPAPPEFSVQIPILEAVISDLGIVRLDRSGYEADDLLGTLSRIAEAEGVRTYIMTGDRDAFQLVSEHVHVLMNRKGVSELDDFGPDAVREKYQLEPSQLIDLKALQGDTSDNIPGVKGIGEKTATALMARFGSLKGVYERLSEVKPDRIRGLLATYQSDAWMSQKLAKIDRHVPIQMALSQLEYQPNWATIVSVFTQYEFKSLATKYGRNITEGSVSAGLEPVEHTVKRPPAEGYLAITSLDGLVPILPKLQAGFAIDLETTSLQVRTAQIVGVAVAWGEGDAAYIALNDAVSQPVAQLDLFGGGRTETQWQLHPMLAILAPLLSNPEIPKWTHNGKYEIGVLANYGIQLCGIQGDSMLAGFLVDPLVRVGLKDMALRVLGVTMTEFSDVVGVGKHQVPLVTVPVDRVAAYAAADADMTLQLSRRIEPMITDSATRQLYRDIELPLMAVLADIELTGVAIDSHYLSELGTRYTARLQALETAIHHAAGGSFNINSTKQLAEILFDRLGLPVIKATKTGRSTDSDVLAALVSAHPIAADLLEYRKLEKLMNTYVSALPQLVNPDSGRVHTSFNQTRAVTGRLSSSNPNLQNIPIRDPEGIAIRRAFVPSRPDGFLLSADYSQIELRLMAHLANDTAMIHAFQAGLDIHTATAATLFGVPIDQVTKPQRYQAKAVNFGIIYGISAFGLSQNIGVSRTEAKSIIDGYFKQFPNIKLFMDQTVEMAERDGYVTTEFGRRRPLPEILDRNAGRRQFAERTAINTRVQGTAADLIKRAMVAIHRRLCDDTFQSKMTIQVHDELVFDGAAGEQDRLSQLVKAEMESAWHIQVPLVADVSIGKNWEDA